MESLPVHSPPCFVWRPRCSLLLFRTIRLLACLHTRSSLRPVVRVSVVCWAPGHLPHSYGRVAFRSSPAFEQRSQLDGISTEIDPELQRRAREYARIRHRLLLVDLGIAALFLLILLTTGFSTGLRDALAPTGTWQPIAHWAPLQ